MAHSLRVAHRVGDGDRAALRDPSSGKRSRPTASTTASRSRTQLERELGHVPVGQPAAPLVVAHEPEAARQLGSQWRQTTLSPS